MYHSIAFLQPPGDAPPEPQARAVRLPALRRQPRPPAHDPDLAQLAGGLHQQLPQQLGRQWLLRTPVSRRPQVSPSWAGDGSRAGTRRGGSAEAIPGEGRLALLFNVLKCS